jgi:hypothetical protein
MTTLIRSRPLLVIVLTPPARVDEILACGWAEARIPHPGA